jgi:cell division protein FtsI/penicillin-binding protein 2
MGQRIRMWSFLFALGLALLGLRLFAIQVLLHPRLAKEAERLQRVKAQLLGARGTIYDRNGVPLAFSRISYSIFADPGTIDPAQHPAAKLAPAIHRSQAEIVSLLARPGRFEWLRRRADDDMVARLRDLCKAQRGPTGKVTPGLRGIGFIAEKKRLYPYEALAGQTMGFVRNDHAGGAGIELACDGILSGRDGYLVAEVDGSSKRRVIPGRRLQEVDPVSGGDVYLTLDVRLQEMAEMALRQAVQSYQAAGGSAIVIDPMSGDVLALANCPAIDPNRYRESAPERWRNPAVTCVYEPGSTFKLVAACAALEHTNLTPESPVVCCTGSKAIGRRTIHCVLHGGSRAHGALTLRGVVVKSCNIGAATLAAAVGKRHFYDTLRALGFTQRTGIGLPGEATGAVPAPELWGDIRLANLGFGQGITVTPLQLVAAYGAIAAGGVLPPLHIIDHIGSSPAPHRIGRRVLSPRTARIMLDILRDVVTEGTGKAAQVDGFTVAGKTGTAQKATPEMGYNSGRYVGSFVGFAPAEDPRIAILVIIDEPKGSHYGGVVAAPAFAEIARRGLAYLGMPPRMLVQAQEPERRER